MNYTARHPAAFINALSEGPKSDVLLWLQKTWDELVDAKAAAEDAERWQFFTTHAFDNIEGKRLADWLPESVLTHGSLTKAIDHARDVARRASVG